MISLKTFGKSLRHAFRGLKSVAMGEQSFRLQLIAAVAVYALIALISLAVWERVLLILLVSMVLVLEILNTILERIADAVEPRVSPMVKEIKDMMAGAVLITAVTTAVVGLMILLPHLDAILEEVAKLHMV
jgi:diacylglycerol kinase